MYLYVLCTNILTLIIQKGGYMWVSKSNAFLNGFFPKYEYLLRFSRKKSYGDLLGF